MAHEIPLSSNLGFDLDHGRYDFRSAMDESKSSRVLRRYRSFLY